MELELLSTLAPLLSTEEEGWPSTEGDWQGTMAQALGCTEEGDWPSKKARAWECTEEEGWPSKRARA